MAAKTDFNSRQKIKGIAILWLALSLVVLLLFMGISIDGARIYFTASQLQIAADASALAGARYVAWDPNSTTKIESRLKAEQFANANYAAGQSVAVNLTLDNGGDAIQDVVLSPDMNHPGDIIIGRYPLQIRQFIPTLDTPDAMKVVVRKRTGQANAPLPLVFGPIVNVSEATIQEYAIAKIINASGAAIIATSPNDVGLYLHGTPDIEIDNGGSIYVNSLDMDATDLRGNPDMNVAELNVGGDVSISGNYDFTDTDDFGYNDLPASLNKNVDPIVDPYATLDEPPLSGISPTAPADGNVLQITEGIHTLQPGYYPGGIKITGGSVTLTAGIYQIDGPLDGVGLSMTGGDTTAEGVLLHIVGGSVDIRGNTEFTLSPPTSGDYAGISIFQSRTNSSQAEINGKGNLDMTGVLYFPNNHLVVSGEGDTIGTQLIADTIEIAGTGLIKIPYDGSPEIASRSFLVE